MKDRPLFLFADCDDDHNEAQALAQIPGFAARPAPTCRNWRRLTLSRGTAAKATGQWANLAQPPAPRISSEIETHRDAVAGLVKVNEPYSTVILPPTGVFFSDRCVDGGGRGQLRGLSRLIE